MPRGRTGPQTRPHHQGHHQGQGDHHQESVDETAVAQARTLDSEPDGRDQGGGQRQPAPGGRPDLPVRRCRATGDISCRVSRRDMSIAGSTRRAQGAQQTDGRAQQQRPPAAGSSSPARR